MSLRPSEGSSNCTYTPNGEGVVICHSYLNRRMLETASDNGVKLRGQTKTHKTVEGGILQTGGTKRGIVTSTFVEVNLN